MLISPIHDRTFETTLEVHFISFQTNTSVDAQHNHDLLLFVIPLI